MRLGPNCSVKQTCSVIRGALFMYFIYFHRGVKAIDRHTEPCKERKQITGGITMKMKRSSHRPASLPAGAGLGRVCSGTVSSLWLPLTLICIVFGLQFQLAGLELVVFHLDLQLFLLLFQGIFKLNKFLYVQGRETGVVNVGGPDDIGPSEGQGLGLRMWAPPPQSPFPSLGERRARQLPKSGHHGLLTSCLGSLGALKLEEPTRSL